MKESRPAGADPKRSGLERNPFLHCHPLPGRPRSAATGGQHQPALATGVVTAADGTPVPGALVTTSIGGIEHQFFTDQAGRYTIRTRGQAEPGTYRISCGGVTKTATVAAGKPATVNYAAVDPRRARVAAG